MENCYMETINNRSLQLPCIFFISKPILAHREYLFLILGGRPQPDWNKHLDLHHERDLAIYSTSIHFETSIHDQWWVSPKLCSKPAATDSDKNSMKYINLLLLLSLLLLIRELSLDMADLEDLTGITVSTANLTEVWVATVVALGDKSTKRFLK